MIYTQSTRARTTAIATLLALAPMLLVGCAINDGGSGTDTSDTDKAPPTARIVVVIDESLSFQSNLPAAARIIQRFIKENAVSGASEVYLIGMDRVPHMIDHYPAEQLLNKEDSKLLNTITAPNPLDGTDVVGALRLAQEKLAKNNGTNPGRRFLLVFSDCYCDRQTKPLKNFAQLEDFGWSNLKDTESNFYFVADKNEPIITSQLQKAGVKGLVLDPVESAHIKPETHIEESDSSE